MKMLVVLLGLITTSLQSGHAAEKVKIRAYNSTGEVKYVPNRQVAFTLGTRLLLTCNVTGLSEGKEVVSYRWFRNCNQLECEIRNRDPYYRVVTDTLLVDVISLDQGGKYYCFVNFRNMLRHADISISTSTINITVADNHVPFLYTPTSLLPEHSVLTDVQQATGKNRQQWITCRSGRQRPRPEIWMESKKVNLSNRTANSATIGLGIHHPNGLYHCLSAQSQRQYFSLFLQNSVTLPTPTVSDRDTSMWTIASSDGSQVERYIVEFECSVRNMTFVEKYTSVNASGGTGQVATNVSCFGGLGQLYRVKVWAVSEPSISRALTCLIQDKEKGGRGTPTPTVVGTPVNTDKSLPTPSGPQGSSTDHANMPSDGSRGTATTALNRGTPTIEVNQIMPTPTVVTTPGNAVMTLPTPSGPHVSSTDHANIQLEGEQSTIGIFIGVGLGVSMFLLLVLSILVAIILVVVLVRKKTANKQKRDATIEDNPHYSNTVVVNEEMEMKEKGVNADYKDVDGYQDVDKDDGEDNGPFDDGFDPYEVVDRKLHTKNVKKSAPKESSPPASANNVPHIYAVVDKCKKKGATEETEDGCNIAKNDLYAMPMKKMGKMTDKGEGVVESGGVEEGEQYDDTVGFKYDPKADSEQLSEGGFEC